MRKVVLVLDDEPGVRHDLAHWLSLLDFTVHTASAIDDAKKIISAEHVDFAVVDLKVDFRTEIGGSEVLHYLRRNQPQAKAIILSAHDFTQRIREEVEGVYDGFVSKGGQENYIRSVITKIKELSRGVPKRQCFVIMPFSETATCREEDWTEIFVNVIKPAVEDSGHNFECNRAACVSGNIIEDILDNLNRADLVIADLTDRNANVFYELGVRHALRRGTILITQKIGDVPFDLLPYAIQEYRWKTKAEKDETALRLREVITELELNPEIGASPVLKYLGRAG
jgi:CheY-like chemotaxis protein